MSGERVEINPRNKIANFLRGKSNQMHERTFQEKREGEYLTKIDNIAPIRGIHSNASILALVFAPAYPAESLHPHM